MAKYNTVKTGTVVNEAAHTAARRAIDACPFLTPETERDIDLALGLGSSEVNVPRIGEIMDERESVTVLNEIEVVDILDAAGPTDEELVKIEAEQK